MRVLVIGGTLFIGRAVVDQLVARGHEVAALHRHVPSSTTRGQILHIRGNRDALEDCAHEIDTFGPDVVLHHVCYTDSQAKAFHKFFHNRVAHLVVLSSGDVYRAFGRLLRIENCATIESPLLETSPLRERRYTRRSEQNPDDDYEKIDVEEALLSNPHHTTTILRLPMVYGPHDPAHRLYPYLKRMHDQRPAILLEDTVSRWRACRGYVANVAHAIALAVDTDPRGSKVYNVADDPQHTELEWVQAIARAFDWQGELVVLPTESVPEHLRFRGDATQDIDLDTTRIREQLGFDSPVPVGESLARTIEWELQNPPTYDAADFDYAAEDRALGR